MNEKAMKIADAVASLASGKKPKAEAKEAKAVEPLQEGTPAEESAETPDQESHEDVIMSRLTSDPELARALHSLTSQVQKNVPAKK